MRLRPFGMTQQPHARESSDGAAVKHPPSLVIRDGIMLGEMLTDESLRRACATRPVTNTSSFQNVNP